VRRQGRQRGGSLRPCLCCCQGHRPQHAPSPYSPDNASQPAERRTTHGNACKGPAGCAAPGRQTAPQQQQQPAPSCPPPHHAPACPCPSLDLSPPAAAAAAAFSCSSTPEEAARPPPVRPQPSAGSVAGGAGGGAGAVCSGGGRLRGAPLGRLCGAPACGGASGASVCGPDRGRRAVWQA
jgi:hypothetical protein